jgi:prepilin-type N-terminal cleavage/methylation domain-containing protein
MNRRSQEGFSLIEVIIALALMGGVLLSIAGLFAYASKQVRSGRSSSEALAVGRQILEEMNDWSFNQTWQLFDPSGTFAVNTYTVDTDTNNTAFCTRWRTLLESKLGASARATIRIDSLAKTGTPPNLNASPRNVRVTVTVFWNEMARARNVAIGTVRM